MSRLRIGLLAPPWLSVPPRAYGGTEAVVDTLARGLSDGGCEVTLFTTGDSTCPVRRRWVYPAGLGTEDSVLREMRHVKAAYEALEGRVDLIHDHTLLGPLWSMGRHVAVPVVTTVHGPFTDDLTALYEAVGTHLPLVALSNAHRASAPSVVVHAVVHHGIAFEQFPPGRGEGGYVAFLGRMSPDKGPDRAIRAARAAGVRIVLAAKVWEEDERRYFAEVVEPLLGADAVFVGEVGARRRAELLGGATALLNPIRWPEPFGLVMVEAMACGTPVVSFAEGSAPELVEPGITGLLCQDEVSMAAAIPLAATLDRARCRAEAEARFGAERMVHDYVRLYQEVLDSRHRRPLAS